eukprot:5284712-Prymnesium_polylepis.1
MSATTTVVLSDNMDCVSAMEMLQRRVEALEARLGSVQNKRRPAHKRLSAQRPVQRPGCAGHDIRAEGGEYGDYDLHVDTAAAAVFHQRDLVWLVLRHLNLPALRLLKPLNKCVAAAARRVLLSTEWLASPVAA